MSFRGFQIRKTKYKYALVAAARWESEHIVEWLGYHASIGFDHVYLYCNDDDPTAFFHKIHPFTIGKTPFVTYYHCKTPGIQRRMFVHFLEMHGSETEWVGFFDIDEFLRISTLGSIDALVSAFPKNIDSLYLNWAYFGNNGFKERPKGSVLLNYVRRQHGLDRHTKTITRSRSISFDFLSDALQLDVRFQHGWFGPGNAHMRRINVLGDDMTDYCLDGDKDAEYISDLRRARAIYDVAVLHHYAMKSEADFLRRVRRGARGDHQAQARWQTMWDDGSWRPFLDAINSVEDSTLHDYWVRQLSVARRAM